jgi:hypothetical protein
MNKQSGVWDLQLYSFKAPSQERNKYCREYGSCDVQYRILLSCRHLV